MTAPGDEELERCQRRVGTTIRGKWHVDRLLGIGGMAAVYAATHKMGRQDAIKILHPHVAVSKELRARFEQEAMAISKLNHPGTVRVIDIDTTDDGRPFMVMELLDGESLGERAARSLPEAREVLRIMDRVLDVLAAAHDLGVVHRDIKLDNLFLARDGRVVVLDFGIARMRQGGQGIQTRTGAMLGTTSYMSPEQIQGRNVDGRADLFAVGACMFRLLAGRRLHDAESDAELLIKMGTLPAPALLAVAPQIDPSVAAIVDRALAFDAAARFSDARAMQHDIRVALGGEAPRSLGAPTSAAAPVSVAAVSAPQALEPTAHQPTAAAPARKVPVGWVVAIGLAGLLVPVALGLMASSWLSSSTSSSATARDGDETEDEPSEREVESPGSATAGVLPVGPATGTLSPPTARPGPPVAKGRGKGKDKKKKKDDH
jgi:eukaryotic-like serine/threonine-protein kinase